MKHIKNLKVVKAPTVDREKLIVRINSNDKPNGINWYDYVELKSTQSDKRIICKLHGDDIPEIKYKRDSLIHINEPLRYKLYVTDDKNYEFEISKKTKNFLVAWSYFIRYHPDDIVRVSTWLAIIAVKISIISIFMGVISLIITFC